MENKPQAFLPNFHVGRQQFLTVLVFSQNFLQTWLLVLYCMISDYCS